MHSAPAPISYSRLPAGVTGAGLCPASAGFGHICQSSRHIRLTHGVVCHFSSPPSRSRGIEDSDRPLGSCLYVEVPDLYCLLVAPLVPSGPVSYQAEV